MLFIQYCDYRHTHSFIFMVATGVVHFLYDGDDDVVERIFAHRRQAEHIFTLSTLGILVDSVRVPRGKKLLYCLTSFFFRGK